MVEYLAAICVYSAHTDRAPQVAHLGKSVRLAGELGSEGIPADLKSTETVGGHPITAVSNSQAFKLAQKF